MAYMGVEARADGSLYCDISLDTLGLPRQTSYHGFPILYPIDTWQQLGSIFKSQAQATCPVDTGYWRDHNDFAADDGGCEMWSSAPYSVYQEYGTSRCRAQPWFEAAVQAGVAETRIEEEFRSFASGWNEIDRELNEIEYMPILSIVDCETAIGRLQALKARGSEVNFPVSYIDEVITRIEATENEIRIMMMQAEAFGGLFGKDAYTIMMEQIGQYLGMLIGSMLAALISATADALFEGEVARMHNPSH